MKVIEEMLFDTFDTKERKFNLSVVENEKGERGLYSGFAYVCKQVGVGRIYPLGIGEEEILSCGHKVDIRRLEGLIAKAKAK